MKKRENSKLKIIIVIFIILITLSISVAYSIFNSNLYISGEVTIRSDIQTRITGITLIETTSSAYESFKPIYNVNTINVNTCHPYLDSTITYTVSLKNNKTNDIIITNIEPVSYDNENITYEIEGIDIDDIIPLGNTIEFTIILKYKDSISSIPDSRCLGLVLDFSWEDYHNNPLTANIDTYIGETSSSTLGAPFNVKVTNRNSKEVTFNFNSGNSYFNVYNTDGTITENVIAGKETKNYLIYVKETSDSVFSSTTQNINLTINVTNIQDSEPLTIGTLTINVPELPKYDMISGGYTDETDSNLDYSNVDSSSAGVYRTEGPNGGYVYFYRGAVDNNYVTFAGYTWRILQIDENGNLRVIMDGIISSTTLKYRDTYSASDETTAINLVHYNNSNAKTTLDSWYNTNIANNSDYSSKVVPSNFCIDTSYASHTSTGTQSSVYYFKSYQAVGQDVALYNPSLTCDSQYIITENIGLISAEEMVMAGSAYRKSNNSYFLYNSSITTNFWTLSPAYWDNSIVHSVNVFIGKTDGSITDWVNGNMLTNSYALRPVITLDGSYNATGTGTISDPYVY